MKKTIFMSTVLKLLFITSITLGNPGGANYNRDNYETVNNSNNNVTVVYLTNDTFKKLVFDYEKNKEWKYEGNRPAIIDFYASWCAPCRQLSPIVEELAKEYSGRIVVYKVDTDKEKALAQKLGISGLPTLLFIPLKGKPQSSMGLIPKATLVKAINEVLQIK
jgi:thioredoxin 1